MPAGGSIIRALTFASDREPITLGKPNAFGINLICEKYNIDKKKAIMIGDSLNSDILVGINAGIDTALVLTGNTSEE